MKGTKYIWMDGKFVAWKRAKVHVLTHALHYGSGVFEGIRCYETEGGVAIFRLGEHVDRLYYSASRLKIKIPYPKWRFTKAIIETVKKNRLKEGYIRPLCYYGYGNMGLPVEGAPVNCSIAVWPWPKYLKPVVRVKASKFIRIHPKSTYADAKICGHYVNSILASIEAKGSGYDEALLLDYKGNVAEGPGENFFIVKNNQLSTPPLGTILKGITRDSIIRIARDQRIPIQERPLKLRDVLKADEAFFCGTAAEVTGIDSINRKRFGMAAPGPMTTKLRDTYIDIVHGRNNKYRRWLSYVS